MFTKTFSILYILSLALILISGCKSTSANFDSKINTSSIKVEKVPTSLSPIDKKTYLELLLDYYSSLEASSVPFEVVAFDSNYQINTENGRVVVSLHVSESGMLEMDLQDQCTNCDKLVYGIARKIYEQVASLYEEHYDDFLKFVELYDTHKMRAIEKASNLDVLVVDQKERLSSFNLGRIANTIKVKLILEKTKKEAFSFDGIYDLDQAIKLAIMDEVNVDRFKVSYSNITKIIPISQLESTFIAKLKNLSADLLPDRFTSSNEDLKISMIGNGVTVSNRTEKFIEFQKISIYYGNAILSLQPKNKSLPPMSEGSELLSDLSFFGRYNHTRLIPITESKQKVPFGFAIKYKIGSDDKTLFETNDVSNVLMRSF